MYLSFTPSNKLAKVLFIVFFFYFTLSTIIILLKSENGTVRLVYVFNIHFKHLLINFAINDRQGLHKILNSVTWIG